LLGHDPPDELKPESDPPLEFGRIDGPGTILLLDPSPITRESLVHILTELVGDLPVYAVAGASVAIPELPELVLLHLHHARVDDPAVQDQIEALRKTFGQGFRIAVLTDIDQGMLAAAAIHRQEIHGYIPTSLAPPIVAAAIRLVLAGGTFIPLELIASEASYAAQPETLLTESDAAVMPRLTSREADVLQLLRLGKPNKIIAFDLAISESTVKVHVRNIMKKMRVTNRTQVALLTDTNMARDSHPGGANGQASPHVPAGHQNGGPRRIVDPRPIIVSGAVEALAPGDTVPAPRTSGPKRGSVDGFAKSVGTDEVRA